MDCRRIKAIAPCNVSGCPGQDSTKGYFWLRSLAPSVWAPLYWASRECGNGKEREEERSSWAGERDRSEKVELMRNTLIWMTFYPPGCKAMSRPGLLSRAKFWSKTLKQQTGTVLMSGMPCVAMLVLRAMPPGELCRSVLHLWPGAMVSLCKDSCWGSHPCSWPCNSWGLGFEVMSMTPNTTKGSAEAQGFISHQRPCCCLRTVGFQLLPRVMSESKALLRSGSEVMSMVLDTTEDSADTQGLVRHLSSCWCSKITVLPGPYWSGWPILPPW